MRRISFILALALMATLSVSASVTAQEEMPAAGEEAAAPVEAEKIVSSNVRFFRELNNTENATVGQAYRLAHILYQQRMGNKAAAKARQSDAWYRDELINAGLISSEWTDHSDRLLSHIGFSFLCARAAKIEGGVMWTLSGHQRYAHREMVDRGLFPNINPRQYMSGPQALAAYRACRKWIENAQRALEEYMPIEPVEPMPEEGNTDENGEADPVEE